MRLIARPLTGLTVLALTAALAACGSSGGSAPARSSQPSAATPVATYRTLTGGSTTVTLAPSFVSRLTALKLAPGAAAPATLRGSTLTFPITGGNATVYAKGATPRLTGTVRHSGGIALSARGAKVQLTDFVLALGAKPSLTGKVLINGTALGNAGITMFVIDTSGAGDATTSGGATTVSGGKVYVDPSAATALNAAFGLSGSDALPTGADALEVGTAAITLKG